jgi:ketosteroid isomerase-like protein
MDKDARIAEILEWYEAWNRGDVEAITDVPEDFVFDTHVRVPGVPEVVRGREELRKFYYAWYEDAWDGGLTQRVERIWFLDEHRYLTNVTFSGTGRSSGARVPDLRYTHIHDQAAHRMDGYLGWNKALAKAGLDPDHPPEPDWQHPEATGLTE